MKNPSQQIADLIDEIVIHKVEVVTDSDWFIELVDGLVDERVKSILKYFYGKEN